MSGRSTAAAAAVARSRTVDAANAELRAAVTPGRPIGRNSASAARHDYISPRISGTGPATDFSLEHRMGMSTGDCADIVPICGDPFGYRMKSLAVMGSASVVVTRSAKSAPPSPSVSASTSQLAPPVFSNRSCPAEPAPVPVKAAEPIE